MSNEKEKMYLDDSLIMRFVQVFQEAMLTGTDAGDAFRMVQVELSPEKGKLVMTPEYVALVKTQHDNMLKFIAEVKAPNEG